jgi:hypothetical protein
MLIKLYKKDLIKIANMQISAAEPNIKRMIREACNNFGFPNSALIPANDNDIEFLLKNNIKF